LIRLAKEKEENDLKKLIDDEMNIETDININFYDMDLIKKRA